MIRIAQFLKAHAPHGLTIHQTMVGIHYKRYCNLAEFKFAMDRLIYEEIIKKEKNLYYFIGGNLINGHRI